MISYGSLFSGAGLLDYGLEVPELQCRFAIEKDSGRQKIFGVHFSDAILYGNIENVESHKLPHVDGLIGGVPCNTHSTSNTAGERGLAPEWTHAKRLIRDLDPDWSLWESSAKDQSWRRWVPFVRRDLYELGHASVPFRLRTAGRDAPHDRDRAFVISWSASSDAHRDGKPSRAIHAEASRLREAPARVWDGRIPPCARGRLADGTDTELARAIGLGVDQRTAYDAGRILEALLQSIEER